MPASARAAKLRGTSIALACSCLVLGACGGSHRRAGTSGAPSPRHPSSAGVRADGGTGVGAGAGGKERARSSQTVVARVGRAGITLAAVRHLMALHSQSLQAAVSRAIHAEWLIEEGREEGIRLSPGEIQRELQARKRSLGSNAEFEAYLRETGQSVADVLLELRLARLTDGIFANERRRERRVTAGEVLAYYNAHKSQFLVPEARDVRILRTTTKAAALRVRRGLAAHGSFAAAARELAGIGQPIGAVDGEVAGLLPGVFEEAPLNDAIFRARLHELYGPLEITAAHKTIAPETNSGWFVFEVTRRRTGRLKPAAEVRDAIVRRLQRDRRYGGLAQFIASFRRKWRARSSCAPGYVVRNCRQFVAPPGTREPEDPYTL